MDVQGNGMLARAFAAIGAPDDTVTVFAKGVREGAVVLGRSRKCARRVCRTWIVPAHNERYCCGECRRLETNKRRRNKRVIRR